jgi:hypothetical protein
MKLAPSVLLLLAGLPMLGGFATAAAQPAGASPANPTAASSEKMAVPAPASTASARVSDATDASLTAVLASARTNRCATALCWGLNDKWAIEPLAELPVGKTFALWRGTQTALGDWIDSHDITVSLTGGLRMWLCWDMLSISLYFSAPLGNANETIHVKGSTFEYPTSNIRRPFPGLALGLLGDTVWMGLDYQELLNGDSVGHADTNYALNASVSHAWSLTVGLATITTLRSGLGLATTGAKAKANTGAAPASNSAAAGASGPGSDRASPAAGAGSSSAAPSASTIPAPSTIAAPSTMAVPSATSSAADPAGSPPSGP